MWNGFQIWADGLPHVTLAFIPYGTQLHTVLAQEVGVLEDNTVTVENLVLAIHTTTS